MSEYIRIIAGDDIDSITKEKADLVASGTRQFLQEREMSQMALAKRAGVAASTLSTFLTGMYGGDWKSLAWDLDRYLEQAYLAERPDSLADWVETRVARNVLAVVKAVQEDGGIGLIHGESGVGKTTVLRMVAMRTPMCVFLSAATAKARMKGLLVDIGRAVHRCVEVRTLAETFNLCVDALCQGCRLLIIDEIHKFCGRDECFDLLRDLLDNTNVPQIWSGTTDLIRYFDRKIGQGREPLAQIRRRITMARDLGDVAAEEGGMFSAGEIRKFLAPGRYKLDPAAVRYLVQLANLRNEGALGLVKNLYATAARVAAATKAPIITVDVLRQAHGYQVSQRTRKMVDTKMAQEAAACTASGEARAEPVRAAV